MKKTIAIVGLIACGSAWAADGPSYNHVQLDYIADSTVELEQKGTPERSADGDGFNISGVFSFSDMLYLKGGYENVETDVADVELINAGVGVHSSAYTGGVDVFGALTIESLDVSSTGTGHPSDEGFGIEIGAAMLFTDAIEGSISYQYADIGDVDGGVFRIAGGYMFMPQWSARVDFLTGEYEGTGYEIERENISIGVRYQF